MLELPFDTPTKAAKMVMSNIARAHSQQNTNHSVL